MLNSFMRFLFISLMSSGYLLVMGQTDFNKVDEKGLKNGLWKGYYQESKRLRYEGSFQHGKEIGLFRYFDDTKAQKLIATRDFSAKDNSAYTIFYNQSGSIVSEGKVVDKQYEGKWTYYHENSKVIMTIENYSKGKLNGVRQVFYLNSNKAEETTYKNGVKNGPYKKYALNGVVLEESNYVDGQFDGKAVYREPQGNVVSQGIYVNGKKKGIWQFYEGGKLVKEEHMSKVKKAVKSKSK